MNNAIRLNQILQSIRVISVISLFVVGCMLSSVSPSYAVSVGQAAPATAMTSIKGDGVVKLSDHLGKVVLVDFWASWCPPCRKSLPLFQELQESLSSSDFAVFAINVDEEPNDGIKLYNQLKIDYDSGLDPNGEFAEIWQVRGMPTSFLVDQTGTVRLVHTGFRAKDFEHLKREIMQLIDEK